MARLALLALALALAAPGHADPLAMFPDRLGDGTRQGEAHAYDARTVFDYMDGAAEPYLRFDFRQLYAAAYLVEGKEAKVELFDMGSSPEAYGVFSTDMEGEPVPGMQAAVYLGGVLRAWQGRYFLKVTGAEATAAVKAFAAAAARHFGEAIGERGGLPALFSALPRAALRPTGFRYVHAHEDLNIVYYVSTENLLGLSKQTEVVMADCTVNGQPARAAVVRYPDAASRDRAWARFCRGFLSPKAAASPDGSRVEAVRKGRFAGIRRFTGEGGRPMLALCLDARTAAACRAVLQAIAQAPRTTRAAQ